MTENIWTENETKMGQKSSEDKPVKGKFRGYLLKTAITEPLFNIIVFNVN